MDSKRFEQIESFYRKRRNHLLLDGASQRATAFGYWAASEPKQVFGMFRKLELENYRRFVDLGSGDGIVVAVASLFTDASGIEADMELHKAALDMKKQLGLKYNLENKDFLHEDLSQYDFIFMSPDNHFHLLEKKLVEEFKGTLVLADNMFRPLTLRPKSNISVEGISFSVYSLSQMKSLE